MWDETSSTMGWGILWNHSLKGLLSTTLISCFARSVQPNYSRLQGENVIVFSLQGMDSHLTSDHPSRPDKSSCWKNTSLLLSTVILVHWIPCTSSSSSKVPGVTSTWGTAFTTTTWVTLMPLVIVIRMAIMFFTTAATCLLLEITSVYVFITLKP